ncbi:MAG: hypothetical protein WDO15_29150 [Bacteroidota bacterium]
MTTPEVKADKSVVFRVKAPHASSAQVQGSFPSSFARVVPMVKKDSTFEATIGPLPSDMYEYDIVLDGVPMLDPRQQCSDERRCVDTIETFDSWRTR